MALPSVNDLKAYLRIESTAEDALLDALLLRARAMLESWTDTPIVATTQTAVDQAHSLGEPVRALVFPRRPANVTAIVDMDGVPVDPTTYWVSQSSGVVYGKNETSFPYGPYTITAQIGLSLRSDYARIEPMLAQAIIDLAADLYQRRTPGAASETAAGTSISWDASRDTVARVMKDLRYLKLGIAQ